MEENSTVWITWGEVTGWDHVITAMTLPGRKQATLLWYLEYEPPYFCIHSCIMISEIDEALVLYPGAPFTNMV